jgi:transcriptional regulator with XRE-family HTH domain
MIMNERQYRITKAEADKFEKLIKELTVRKNRDTSMSPVLHEVEISALNSQLADLRTQIAEYDDLRSGKQVLLESASLDDLPRVLIKARIAAGWSQKQLAAALKLKEQQIQKYEANSYTGASIYRLIEVADALNLKVRKDFFLPVLHSNSFDVFKRLSRHRSHFPHIRLDARSDHRDRPAVL